MSSYICSCGHPGNLHVYDEGPCRPGFVCPSLCDGYDPVEIPIPPRPSEVPSDQVWLLRNVEGDGLRSGKRTGKSPDTPWQVASLSGRAKPDIPLWEDLADRQVDLIVRTDSPLSGLTALTITENDVDVRHVYRDIETWSVSDNHGSTDYLPDVTTDDLTSRVAELRIEMIRALALDRVLAEEVSITAHRLFSIMFPDQDWNTADPGSREAALALARAGVEPPSTEEGTL